MVNVYSRSFIDKVFASPCSSKISNNSWRVIQVDNDQISSQLYNVHGNTVDFLNLLKNSSNIRVVAVVYAGLTTYVSDFKVIIVAKKKNWWDNIWVSNYSKKKDVQTLVNDF